MPDTTRTRRGRGEGRVNVAGGVCFRPGHRARLVHRLHVCNGRAGEPKTFAGCDDCDLFITVHRHLTPAGVVPGQPEPAFGGAAGGLRRGEQGVAAGVAKHTPGERNWHVPMTDTWARVPEIDVPVLTVNGTLDSPDLLADAERFANTAHNGRSVLVEGTSHFPGLEKPEEFNATLQDFLCSL